MSPTWPAPIDQKSALAGLLADIRAGAIPPSESVVFLHTGGLPGIFAHATALAAWVGIGSGAPTNRASG